MEFCKAINKILTYGNICVAYEHMITIDIHLGKDGDDIATRNLMVLDTKYAFRE